MSTYIAPRRNISGSQASTTESAVAVASGALMILPVIGKRSFWRWTAAVTGGALIYKGLTQLPETTNGVTTRTAASPVQHLSKSITIGKSATDLYTLWRNPDVLLRVMEPFGTVTIIGANHLRWSLESPIGKYESEATLVDDRPGEMVHWRTTPGNALQVDEFMRFKPAPNGLGTEATLSYDVNFSNVPAGPMVRSITSFLDRVPSSAMRKILYNFKSFAETGEIPTLTRNPSARAQKTNGKGDLV
jgi:uncharacterized membrane protein